MGYLSHVVGGFSSKKSGNPARSMETRPPRRPGVSATTTTTTIAAYAERRDGGRADRESRRSSFSRAAIVRRRRRRRCCPPPRSLKMQEWIPCCPIFATKSRQRRAKRSPNSPVAGQSSEAAASHQEVSQKRAAVVKQLIWRSGDGVRHINEVMLRRARLVLGLVTSYGGYKIPVFIYSGRPGSVRQAIPPWVGAMNTGDGFGHLWEANGAFEVATLCAL